MGGSYIQRSPTDCDMSVIEEPHTRALDPQGLSSHEKKKAKCLQDATVPRPKWQCFSLRISYNAYQHREF